MPKFTGLLVVVLIPKVALTPLASITGVAPEKVRFALNVGEVSYTSLPAPVAPVEVTPSKVVWPVTERVLFTVVAPFKEMAPVPVEKVPVPVWPKLALFCTVTFPLAVRPEVAVISPEIVGVAVQAVPVTVRFPPKVTNPVPKVTGRFVIVFMERVELAFVASITGLVAASKVCTLFKVTFPVPVAKVLLPVTVVFPFREIFPVPVLKVLAPVWEKLLAKVVAPYMSKLPGVAIEPRVSFLVVLFQKKFALS